MATELAKDIAELEKLRGSATRQNVIEILDSTLLKWNSKVAELSAKEKAQSSTTTSATASSTTSGNTIRPIKKLTTYAFDESDKFVKLYYTLSGAQNVSADSIVMNVTEDGFAVLCPNVAGIDYEINVKGLLHPIDPSKSTIKTKTDSLLVMLKKKKEGDNWNNLLKLHKQANDIKPPKLDDSGDPQDSLMQVMKSLYDTGDDEMKRNIRKTWHESQSKKAGEFSDL
ncbi:CS domain-containing protein [Ditylenchus destructor]|nr:CS domain-containing protein [Ditylenchus destructor]